MKKKIIKYYSTNLSSPEVSFREALLKGLAPDGGLYMPSSLPVFSSQELAEFEYKEYSEIAYDILFKLLETEIDSDILRDICREVYNFEVPLEKINDRKYIMRLDQGPTASFKDFAARMMSRLMQHYLSENNEHLTILTATSGDTGSAVASAFHGLENINAVVLYPALEVTDMQRRQMTTLGKNIKIIAVNGKFDDCQRLVKQAFVDPELSGIRLSSANSINIGRLLPQSVYYFYSYSKLKSLQDEMAVFSVPSGNFGNLMGGLIAKRMGLPVRHFIVATNENDEVPEFLRSGSYKPVNPSKNCISSAMNVGHPSNLSRIVALYGGTMDHEGKIIHSPDMKTLRNDLFAISISDDETKQTIDEAYRKYNLLLEPHGAVAWRGLKEYLSVYREVYTGKPLCISLETAHPAKFPEEIRQVLNFDPELPESMAGLDQSAETYTILENNYTLLKDFILTNCKTD